MSARQKTMGRYIPKYPELDQQLFEWFTEQRSQGENSFVMSVFFWGVNKTWNMEHSGTFRNRANYHKINFKTVIKKL